MDFMSFLMGGKFVADALDEYDRQEEEQEFLDDCLYETELARERLQESIEERHEEEADYYDDEDEDDDF